MTRNRIVPVVLTLFVSFVFIQSLFFKFTDSVETQYIFNTLDDWGASLGFAGLFGHGGIFSQYVVGSAELIASSLLLLGLTRQLRILRPIGALLGLVLGTIIGDFGLHLVGRWAAGSRRTEQFRLKPKIAQAEAWLLRRQMGALALARFIPGLRLPTFIASGVLKFPIYRTLAVLSAVTLVWTPALFWLSHSVMIAAETIGLVGWILAAALIVASVMAPRLANRHFAKAAAA